MITITRWQVSRHAKRRGVGCQGELLDWIVLVVSILPLPLGEGWGEGLAD